MLRKLFTSHTGAFFYLMLFSFAGKGIGLLRESVFAAYFGLQQEFDLYLIGAVFPVVINTIVQYIAQNYFIPAFNKVEPKSINSLLISSALLFLISSSSIAILFFAFANPVISFYLANSNPDIHNTAVKVFRIFLITLPANAIISLLTAYFQAKSKFLLPAISQLLLNVIVLIIVLSISGTAGIFSIPIGFVIGNLVQLLLLMFFTFRITTFGTLVLSKDFMSILPKGIGFVLLIEIVGQLFLVVDRFFLSKVDIGGISALNYANTIFILPISIISLTLSTVIFPKFSEHIISDKKKFVENYVKSMSINTFIFVPIVYIIFFFGEDIIKILFFRGKFTLNDVDMTFNILRIFSLSLVFYSAYAIINKALYALGALKSLLWFTLAAFIFKICTNFWFVSFLKQDGLALSTTLSYILISVCGGVYLFLKLKSVRIKETKDWFISILLGAVSVLIVIPIFSFSDFEYYYKFILQSASVLIVYTGISYLLKHRPLMEIIEHVNVIFGSIRDQN